MSERTLILSATNVLARGYYAVPTDRTSTQAEPVNGLFAVTRAVLRAFAFKLPARAVAVIDSAAPRPEWPPLLQPQVALLAPLCAALGLHTVSYTHLTLPTSDLV